MKLTSKELEQLLADAIRSAADSIAASLVGQFLARDVAPDNELTLVRREEGSYGLDTESDMRHTRRERKSPQ